MGSSHKMNIRYCSGCLYRHEQVCFPATSEVVKVAERSRTRDRHVKCPRCDYRYHYRCADGRRKRKRCGKLFNHRTQGPRNEPPPEKAP